MINYSLVFDCQNFESCFSSFIRNPIFWYSYALHSVFKANCTPYSAPVQIHGCGRYFRLDLNRRTNHHRYILPNFWAERIKLDEGNTGRRASVLYCCCFCHIDKKLVQRPRSCPSFLVYPVCFNWRIPLFDILGVTLHHLRWHRTVSCRCPSNFTSCTSANLLATRFNYRQGMSLPIFAPSWTTL